MDMSYLKGACDVNRMDSEGNESVYGKFHTFSDGNWINCGVVEIVICNPQRSSDNLEEVGESEVTKSVCKSKIDTVAVDDLP